MYSSGKFRRAMKRTNGSATALIVVLGCIVILFLAIVYIAVFKAGQTGKPQTTISANSTTSSTTAKTTPSGTTLPPATVSPKIAECSQALTFTGNGNPSPAQCATGGLNKQAWVSVAALEPSVMGLGYGATATQVQSALCADVHANISNPIEQTAYQLSSLYYGWHFALDPSVVIRNGTCVNVDD